MEKSFWKVATTSTAAAMATAAQTAIPARRAVSARRSNCGPWRNSATTPAAKQYTLRARARTSEKLPIKGITGAHHHLALSFQNLRREATDPRDICFFRAASGGAPWGTGAPFFVAEGSKSFPDWACSRQRNSAVFVEHL